MAGLMVSRSSQGRALRVSDRFLVQLGAGCEADGQVPSWFICIYKEYLLLRL